MTTAATGTSDGRARAPGSGADPAGAPAEDEVDGRTDGRVARAERTRTAIVDALLALLEEGDLKPSANRIAERAGISLRLIYHHFGDLESLFQQAAKRQGERLASVTVPVDPTLPIDERVDAFCASRAHTLEWMTPVRRASLLMEPFSDALSRARIAYQAAGDASIRDLFGPELADRDEDDRRDVLDALGAVASWNHWDALRTTGHDEAASLRLLTRTFRALLGLPAR